MLEKVRDTIKRYRLIAKGDKILVGVSGGPDSLALLYILHGLKKELRLTLHIAHLDHMLRKASTKDAQFVNSLAQKLKIPLSTAQINVAALARKGSPEEVARDARLGFLFKVAKKIKADKIALGHNLDDQAETVLMRLLRGTGLYGLGGILPKRQIRGFEIIRPLIETKRKEIEAFLRKKKFKPVQDESNLDQVYLRNKIRRRLLPLLEKEYNKNIKELLANTAQSVACDYDYLLLRAGQAAGRMRASLALPRLLKIHPALRRVILRRAIARVQGDMRRITFQHIREIEDLLTSRPINSIVDLPKGTSVIKRRKSLLFFRKKP